MSNALDRIKDDLGALTVLQRAELAQFLIETLDPKEEADVENAWMVEVDRRVEQVRRGEVQGKAADQVFTEMKAKRN